MSQARWDHDYLSLIEFWANKRSKDPSTKVGCAIVRPDHSLASLAYNGLPAGVKDTWARLNQRELKYEMVAHAEANAIVKAREPLHGYTCYTWPMAPCSRCAALLIQAGIKRVVCPVLSKDREVRWADNIAIAETMLREAGVKLEVIRD